MRAAHSSGGWGRTRVGGGTAASPAFAVESKRAEVAVPFDVEMVVGGARCLGRWQWSMGDGDYYFVHADGARVTPARLLVTSGPRPPPPPPPTPPSHHLPVPSDNVIPEDVQDGDVYAGPDDRYNFYFATTCPGSFEVDYPQGSSSDQHEDVLVLNGEMFLGKMTGRQQDPPYHQFVFQHLDGQETTSRTVTPVDSDQQEGESDDDTSD